MTDSDADAWSDHDTGPFCIHWAYIGDGCDEPCAVCGHGCDRHGQATDVACMHPACTCAGFVEAVQ